MSNIIITHIKQIQISTGRFIFDARFYESINIYFHEHTVAYNYLQVKFGYEESVYCLMIKIK